MLNSIPKEHCKACGGITKITAKNVVDNTAHWHAAAIIFLIMQVIVIGLELILLSKK